MEPHRNENGWIEEYRRRGALWIHNGNPERPHALLTSGNHSGGYFNSRLVTEDDLLLAEAAWDLTWKLRVIGDIFQAQGVVGPQTGATKLAEALRNNIRFLVDDEEVSWASPAKAEFDGKKSMVFGEEDLAAISGRQILLCEDVLTTGGSVDLAAQAVEDAGGIVLPYILALVNRSGQEHLGGKNVVALIDRHMPMWAPGDCPLCKAGSAPLRPKDNDNWSKLNAA